MTETNGVDTRVVESMVQTRGGRSQGKRPLRGAGGDQLGPRLRLPQFAGGLQSSAQRLG